MDESTASAEAQEQKKTRKKELPPVPLSERLAYRIPDAVQASGIGRAQLYNLIGSGELKSVKRAGCRLILREDLEAFLRGEAA